jgi:hypothetical protein
MIAALIAPIACVNALPQLPLLLLQMVFTVPGIAGGTALLPADTTAAAA